MNDLAKTLSNKINRKQWVNTFQSKASESFEAVLEDLVTQVLEEVLTKADEVTQEELRREVVQEFLQGRPTDADVRTTLEISTVIQRDCEARAAIVSEDMQVVAKSLGLHQRVLVPLAALFAALVIVGAYVAYLSLSIAGFWVTLVTLVILAILLNVHVHVLVDHYERTLVDLQSVLGTYWRLAETAQITHLKAHQATSKKELVDNRVYLQECKFDIDRRCHPDAMRLAKKKGGR